MQSANDAALTGAIVTITLIADDGAPRELQITALKDRQIVELDDWIRKRIMQIATASITPDMSEAMQNRIIDRALASAGESSYLSFGGEKWFQTVEGLAQLIFHTQPANNANGYSRASIAEISALFKKVSNVRIASRMFKLCNSGEDESSAATGGNQQSQPTSAQKKEVTTET